MASSNAVNSIIERVRERWPEHRRFLDKTPAPPGATADYLAEAVLRLAGDNLDRFIDGYRWMCSMVQEETLHFRRHGSYRLSSFAEADATVYQSPDLMGRYMDGLLLSQVLWPNHLKIFDFYRHRFLAEVAPGKRHLEVGPGHGLLLHEAARMLSGALEAWDISSSSLQRTEHCLTALGSGGRVRLACRDIMQLSGSEAAPFDSIVMSEVLEHMEDPKTALARVSAFLAPAGKIFVNAPVNSPAIDHIFLFRAPEELIAVVEAVGLKIEEVCVAPAAGYSEEAARKARTTISCAIIAAADRT
jgi:2-polyprenyl-3-methyl-5-hydroxy-6-metoxy-1,4-benzoquinol methylase